ncbi:MAG TPA: single-stranded DNA-binding protein [Steroidobacteraceae bacterium]|nr:single-stranded DNA-binding protein [Steroidobacteraceae bacterium]
MYQRFIAVGRLGREPEVTTTPKGIRVATLSLATSDFVKGEERTEWHRVVVWDERLIDVVERRAQRGSLVAVEGQVRTRRWLRDGHEVATTEVVLDRFHSRLRVLGNGRTEKADLFQFAESRKPLPGEAEAELTEDEIPF